MPCACCSTLSQRVPAATSPYISHSARSYIADDELVEVTPKIVRLRKKKLDPTERKKLVRQAA